MQGYARFERGGLAERWRSELVGGICRRLNALFTQEVLTPTRKSNLNLETLLISENGYTVAESTNEKALT